MTELDQTMTSRNRMLAAGKSLFAQNGYEQTSTASIAREAATSESQLVRYFGGKAGLLEAIFNESWVPLNTKFAAFAAPDRDAKTAVHSVLSTVIEGFGRDHDLAFLFLFEGRRVRSNRSDILLSKGFTQFYEFICRLLQRGQADGTIRKDLNVTALASALMGASEGMIRDRLVAERSGKPNPFTDEEIKLVFDTLLTAV
jgi:AcrR family transcriptional regulator